MSNSEKTRHGVAGHPGTDPLTWGMGDTLERVKKVLRASLKLGADEVIADDMPLVGGEFDLDSLDILLIVTNVEKEFGIQVREGTMDKKAFATVATLAAFVDGMKK